MKLAADSINKEVKPLVNILTSEKEGALMEEVEKDAMDLKADVQTGDKEKAKEDVKDTITDTEKMVEPVAAELMGPNVAADMKLAADGTNKEVDPLVNILTSEKE